jgi:3-mercaptopyruvate sulfurtransferase SseA
MENKNRSQNRVNPSLILIILGALLLIVAAVVLLSQSNTNNVPQPTQAAEIPYPEIKRIGQLDAKAAYDQGTAVFVDVRSAESYAAAHISGAISLPETELETRWTELSTDKLIITYCT